MRAGWDAKRTLSVLELPGTDLRELEKEDLDSVSEYFDLRHKFRSIDTDMSGLAILQESLNSPVLNSGQSLQRD